MNATTIVLTIPASASYGPAANLNVRYMYDTIVLEFQDMHRSSGADTVSLAKKIVVINTPAIDAGGAFTSNSTEGAQVIGLLNTWLATTPGNFAAMTI